MLDKTRKFATVHGHPGVVYSQDGKLYNGQEVEVDESGAVVRRAPVKPILGDLPVTNAPAPVVDEAPKKKGRWS